MFDVTGDDIAGLNDEDLRELVARLCEAELSHRGLSPSSVTWGGNQTAADGGLDVRVALAPSALIDGFIPRPATGFQVKKPDMPRSEIIAEMKPKGTIRPVIRELADQGGSYIIVSSTGSTSDSVLRNRRDAIREALATVPNADHLHTDFYDRTRLATWVRGFPGLISWVRERVGRSLVGWRPYGSWSGAVEGADAEYLLDDKLRIHFGGSNAPVRSIAGAIDQLRDDLAKPGKIMRLVGLSGVGKTRLVQALFDNRVGLRPLPPALAVYTNLSDDPNPQPASLASDLMAGRRRAILIVDNCPPELHRRLAELCGTSNSMISVLTVEYDIRDDQPEGTQVVTLESSSVELTEKLIRRRFPNLSLIDARTIAAASGGNARVAIALGGTVEHSETISGLADDELFQRLFRQRHDPNHSLLFAAQAFSLVYSFQGEALSGAEAELPQLASLVGQSPAEAYRHAAELFSRDLIQQRGVWRAVLPHAIANRLAARALESVPLDLIKQYLVLGGNDRLARSFSRRLSFLHESRRAISITEEWLSRDGLLGNVASLDALGIAMFENVAPVAPHGVLAALERVVDVVSSNDAPLVWYRHLRLLRSLAYDPDTFTRSVTIISKVAVSISDARKAGEASDIFASLFHLSLSGTKATIEQRLLVIESLLTSGEKKLRALGLRALDAVLEATHFSSGYSFEFGAHSRDYGYRPRTRDEVVSWFSAALSLLERLALSEQSIKKELRAQLAQNFRGLWTSAGMFDELEVLVRKFAAEDFWGDGWGACRQTLFHDRDRLPPDIFVRLSALEKELRPTNLAQKIQAIVLGRSISLDLGDIDVKESPVNSLLRIESMARDLGTAAALDKEVLDKFLPDLVRGGNRVWQFGRGLACNCSDICGVWERMVRELERTPEDCRNVQLLKGFLAGIWDQNKNVTHEILDRSLDEPVLIPFFPALQAAVEIEQKGIERLKRSLDLGIAQIWMYRNLAYGIPLEATRGSLFRELLLQIAVQEDGYDVAVEILTMRIYSDQHAKRANDPEIIEAARGVVRSIIFKQRNDIDNYNLAEVANIVSLERAPS